MPIQELIETLQKLLEQHGNIQVFVNSYEEDDNCVVRVDSVEFSNTIPLCAILKTSDHYLN